MTAGNYWTRHSRVKFKRGSASQFPCHFCGGQARDWAQLHDRDGEDPEDYVPSCRKCHIGYDELHVKRVVNYARGERSGGVKLTEEKVLEIRRRRDAGEAVKDLAVAFGVHRDTIRQIVDRRSWTHI